MERDALIDTLLPIVERETGMVLSGERLHRLRAAVEKVLKSKSDAFCTSLATAPQSHPLLIEQIAVELTIGESFFFRNSHHFDALRQQVLPAILRDGGAHREIRLWSAGCSTGEEAYSLAILVDQLRGREAPAARGPRISILATDVNPAFLARGREGVYRPWSFRRTTIHEDERYFDREESCFRIRDAIRRTVRFQYLNLVKDVYPSSLNGTLGMDLILFRNVAIYLRPEVVRKIVSCFFQALRPGGWLLLGESEVNLISSEGFEVKRLGQATFFRRPAVSTSSALAATTAVTGGIPTALREAVTPPPVAAAPVARPGSSSSPSPGWTSPPADKAIRAPSGDSPAAPPASETAWETIERHVARKDFPAARQALNALADHRQRHACALPLVRRLLEFSELALAFQLLEEYLALHPTAVEGQLLKACLEEEQGHLSQAEAAYRRVLYLDPQSAIGYFHLAMLLQRVGKPEAARRGLQRTVALAESQDPATMVEHGDGVCYGRLHEMATTLLQSEG